VLEPVGPVPAIWGGIMGYGRRELVVKTGG
jgi:hypothetical protein